MARHLPTRDSVILHPSGVLPPLYFTDPYRLRLDRPRRRSSTRARATHRVFVTTRAGTDTIPQTDAEEDIGRHLSRSDLGGSHARCEKELCGESSTGCSGAVQESVDGSPSGRSSPRWKVQQIVFVGGTCGSIPVESFNRNSKCNMKALRVLEIKWDPIRKKLVRCLLEEQDKVLVLLCIKGRGAEQGVGRKQL